MGCLRIIPHRSMPIPAWQSWTISPSQECIWLLSFLTPPRTHYIKSRCRSDGVSCTLFYPYIPMLFGHPLRGLSNRCSPHFQRLAKQLEDLEIPFTDDFPTAIESTDHIVDAVFGWSSFYIVVWSFLGAHVSQVLASLARSASPSRPSSRPWRIRNSL